MERVHVSSSKKITPWVTAIGCELIISGSLPVPVTLDPENPIEGFPKS